MFKWIGILIIVCWAAQVTELPAQEVLPVTTTDSAGSTVDTTVAVAPSPSVQTIVYYFHGNKRCMTCRKIEALADQSLTEGFREELADSSIQWRVVNFEEKENAHFAKTYKLFSQTLIVSRQINGEEVGWKNLDQIWQLVHDEEAFLAYVQGEVGLFMKKDPE